MSRLYRRYRYVRLLLWLLLFVAAAGQVYLSARLGLSSLPTGILTMLVEPSPHEDMTEEQAAERDTRLHTCECWCKPCAVKGTGGLAMAEVAETSPDGEITPDLYRRFLQVTDERGDL